ncbi:MAG: ribosome biogenesis GTP-binding protein YihA/YsxC [Saprospiraceae bacterium]|nr:ribosome biogenesis GTP-binding protein YihA/YsxC [Saprospiraceae bacterium]
MKTKSRKSLPWKVNYLGSFVDLNVTPQDKPLVAIVGRSNVGKSSFINTICEFKELARTSSKPGKTQTLNYYEVNRDFYLVDMPGYGYAGVSKVLRQSWSDFSQNFILNATQLTCLFILTDANIEPQELDLKFIAWCGEKEIPIHIIRTKIDRSKPIIINKLEELFKLKLQDHWEELPVITRHSSVTKEGTLELRLAIERMCK